MSAPLVPFLDVHAGWVELQAPLRAAFERVMASGTYVGGEEVASFERRFARACGAGHAVGTGNGLDALALALRAAGIGPGDEVLVPAHTFVASWLAVARAGARPVGVDVDPGTLLLDAGAAAAAVTPRTAAVMPVHLYGQPCDPAPTAALAARHGLFVLEDAAQAFGASFDGRPAGSLGDAAGFSFYPGKNLGAFGDGGAVTTQDAALAGRIRALANYGSRERYVHDEAGENSRLDPLQAAMLDVKLGAMAGWAGRRAGIAALYDDGLEGIEGLTLPRVAPGASSCHHLYCVRHADREGLQAALAAEGIQTLIHYPTPPHRTGAFAHLGLPAGSFPVAEAAAATLLSLPIGPHLGDDDAQHVVEAVGRAVATLKGAWAQPTTVR